MFEQAQAMSVAGEVAHWKKSCAENRFWTGDEHAASVSLVAGLAASPTQLDWGTSRVSTRVFCVTQS